MTDRPRFVVLALLGSACLRLPCLAGAEELGAATGGEAPVTWVRFEADGPLERQWGAILFFFPEALPGQQFGAAMPEWITSREETWFVQTWFEADATSATGTWTDNRIAMQLELRARQLTDGVSLDWEIRVDNIAAPTLHDVTAFNDFNLNASPMFADFALERTWAWDGEGRHFLLREAALLDPISENMRWYATLEGIDLGATRGIANYFRTATTVLSGDRLETYSTDGAWRVQNIVEGRVAYFFNNWSLDHGCMHAAPLVADVLPPGESATARGRFEFRRVAGGDAWAVR